MPSFRGMHLLLAAIGWFLSVGQLSALRSFESLVPKALQKCCRHDHHLSPCKTINAAVQGTDGNFYLFFEDYYITVSSFRPNGYPVLTKSSFSITYPDWGQLNPSDVYLVKAAFNDEGKTTKPVTVIKHQNKYFEFIDGKKPNGSPDKVCAHHHPLFCHRSDELKAAVSLKQQKGPQHVMGIYKKDLSSFDVKLFVGTTPVTGGEISFKTPLTVTAIGVYGKDGSFSLGAYFMSNGYFCFFRHPQNEALSEATLNKDIFKRLLLPKEPHIYCWDLQIFFGCPQSNCWRPDVDDFAMVRLQSVGTPSIQMTQVFRGAYVWETRRRKPPLASLTFNDHHVLGMYFTNRFDYREYFTYIDAAATVPDPDVADGAPDPSPNYKYKDVTYLFKDDMVRVLNTGKLVIEAKISTIFRGLPTSLDAAWFNNKQTKDQMFFFAGDSFWVFNKKSQNGLHITWEPVGGKEYIGNQFHGLAGYVDGVYTFDAAAYIMKEHWYYPIAQDDWDINGRVEIQYKVYSVIGKRTVGGNVDIGLIKVQDKCYAPSEDDRMIKRMETFSPKKLPKTILKPGETTTEEPLPPTTSGTGSSSGSVSGSGPTQKDTTDGGKKGNSMVIIIIVIIVVLFLVLAIGSGVVFFLILPKSKPGPVEVKSPKRQMKRMPQKSSDSLI